MGSEMTDPLSWNCYRVREFLSENGLAEYKKILCDEHRIDGRVLLSLTEKDLLELNIAAALGDIQKLWLAIHDLQSRHSPHNGHISNNKMKSEKQSSYSSDSSYILDLLDSSDDEKHIFTNQRKIDQELWKFGISIVYAIFVHIVTSFAIIFAQERMPNRKTYRPLPDVLLDNIQYIPWAYRITEGVILFGFIALFMVVIFHKYRFIVLRRMLVMAASIFLFRSLCVFITSLPMPQENLKCDNLVFKNGWERISRALEIYSHMGMKVSGLRTCGDYMFSGHTVTITLLIFLINEYTPRRLIFLHALVWIVGLLGIFFIIAGHGHYSIDCVVAFYITSRIFTCHHVFANNRSLMTRDRKRLQRWFPVLYFFESNCDGIVPNEYELPLPYWVAATSLFARVQKFLCFEDISTFH